MKACQISLFVCLAGSLALQVDPPWAEGADIPEADVQDKVTGHRKPVDIPLEPGSIVWVKIDASSAIHLQAFGHEATVLHEQSKPYRRRLPLESQHSREEMDQLRKDQGKWEGIYRIELENVLKEQFYFWDELNQITEALKELRRESEWHSQSYILRIRFKDSISGIVQVNYGVTHYLEAKAIAEDLRKGVIKSLTVYTENLSGWSFDPQAKWVPCGSACWISAFGF